VYGEGQPENSPKVCTADFDTKIGCGGEAYGTDHPLTDAFDDAVDNKANYGQCSEENRGKRGCAPMDGGVCLEGLQINNASGVCDDPDDPIPAIYPPDAGGPDIAGQDAKDQFCRWYFCDESFVCVQSSAGELCRPCEGTDPEDFGSGGCGTIYIEGEPSPIYTPTLDNANCNGDRETTEAQFGSWPAP
jgi:hypothetical protein